MPTWSGPVRRRWLAMRGCWRRRHSPASSRWWRGEPRTIEAWEQPARRARTDAISVGTRVFHQKFGYGTVTAAEDDRLDVAFDKEQATISACSIGSWRRCEGGPRPRLVGDR